MEAYLARVQARFGLVVLFALEGVSTAAGGEETVLPSVKMIMSTTWNSFGIQAGTVLLERERGAGELGYW